MPPAQVLEEGSTKWEREAVVPAAPVARQVTVKRVVPVRPWPQAQPASVPPVAPTRVEPFAAQQARGVPEAPLVPGVHVHWEQHRPPPGGPGHLPDHHDSISTSFTFRLSVPDLIGPGRNIKAVSASDTYGPLPKTVAIRLFHRLR
jgi:hypothetical protein